MEAARAKARTLAQQVETQAYALTDELRQLQKDERMSAQQKAQRAREIAKKETEKLFAGTEVVHNPVKEFVPLKDVKVGQEVCIAELNQLATVLALPDKNGDVLVRAGIIKTKVPLKGLKQPEKLVKEPTAPKTKAQQRYSRLTGDTNRPNGRVERVQGEDDAATAAGFGHWRWLHAGQAWRLHQSFPGSATECNSGPALTIEAAQQP